MRNRRIIVSVAVAFTLEVVLGLATFLLMVVFWTSRRSRRPLGLSQDIGVPNTVASLVAAQYRTCQDLREISDMSAQQAKEALSRYSYAIDQDALRMSSSTSTVSSVKPRESTRVAKRDRMRWEPKVLSTWAICGLIFVLTALLATIAVLYWYSNSHGLYQSAFVYQVEWNIGDYSLGYIAPYSIVPTLLAVIVGLWWGALESIFRTAQPFISMAKGPTTGGKGSGLSYQSSYLAWAGIRAINRQHWLLAFVCTGAFLSQIRKFENFTLPYAVNVLLQLRYLCRLFGQENHFNLNFLSRYRNRSRFEMCPLCILEAVIIKQPSTNNPSWPMPSRSWRQIVSCSDNRHFPIHLRFSEALHFQKDSRIDSN